MEPTHETTNPRIHKLRTAAAIARLGLEQLLTEIRETTDNQVHAEALHLLYQQADPADSILGDLATLLTAAAERAAAQSRGDDDFAEGAACALEEAAGYVQDSAGMRIHLALESLEAATTAAADSTESTDLIDSVLRLTRELRVPVPSELGGYAEVTVERDTQLSDRWAVTDGSVTGKRAWTSASTGWEYIGDVGRATAYRYTLPAALAAAHEVAALEGARLDDMIRANHAQADGGRG